MQESRRSAFASGLVNSATQGQHPMVIDDLRRAILAGDEPPGTLIPIDSVARFFGVSPIPVREALKVLLGEGLVQHVPNVGYSVAKLPLAEFRELYDIRQALEASALRRAVDRATEEDDEALERAHKALATAIENRDERAYHVESRAFHLALIAAARMPRLLHLYVGTWNLTEPARPMAWVSDESRRTLLEDHARMLAAFVARDAEALVRESDGHYAHLEQAIAVVPDDADLFDE
jgi:DNA-binding GntR family transcriptional regulator